MIGSLKAGFDAVANHIGLILLPVALDLFLWLGPRVSVGGLLNPFFKLVFEEARTTLTSSADLKRFTDFQTGFSEIIDRFNLLSLLSRLQTFPIGVSSLLAQTLPIKTPLGSQDVVQISSAPALLGLVLLFVLIGWIAGGPLFPLGIWNGFGSCEGGKQNQPGMGDSSDVDPVRSLVHRLDDAHYPDHVRAYHPDISQSGAGKRCLLCDGYPVLLVDCATIFHAAWDFCPQTERVLLGLH